MCQNVQTLSTLPPHRGRARDLGCESRRDQGKAGNREGGREGGRKGGRDEDGGREGRLQEGQRRGNGSAQCAGTTELSAGAWRGAKTVPCASCDKMTSEWGSAGGAGAQEGSPRPGQHGKRRRSWQAGRGQSCRRCLARQVYSSCSVATLRRAAPFARTPARPAAALSALSSLAAVERLFQRFVVRLACVQKCVCVVLGVWRQMPWPPEGMSVLLVLLVLLSCFHARTNALHI